MTYDEKTDPTVSITIVLHNSERHLEECITAIRPSLEDGLAELVAVDNASTDNCAAIVGRILPKASIVRSERNRGFAGGVNLAWPTVRGRYWLLLNPDATLPSAGLAKLAEWMDEHRDVAIAAPALAEHDGTNVRPTARALPSASLVLLELLRLHRLLPRRIRGQLLQGPYWTGGDNLDAGWVPGTSMIVRREAVEQVGLFDESFFLYGEDIDWCWRMRRAGWRVGYCSTVVVRHVGYGSSMKTFSRSDVLLQAARSEIEVVRKRRGILRARLYALAVTAAEGLESLHPRRSLEQRQTARAVFRAWRSTALRRGTASKSQPRTSVSRH